MAKRHYVLAFIIFINAVAILYYYRACDFWSNCSSANGVFLLAEDQSKHQIMQAAVSTSVGRFDALFNFEEVPSTIVMEAGLVEPLPVRARSQWRMVFDPTGTRRLEEVLDGLGYAATIDRFLLRLDDIGRERLGTEAEQKETMLNTATHEVCHMFFHNMMDGRSYSEALDEIAGISCESEEAISRRVGHFKRLMQEREPMDWDQFLELRHPIREQAELMEAMDAASEQTDEDLNFTVDFSSDLGQQIDQFYHQSAIFVQYWQQKCPNQSVLQNLAVSQSRGMNFSDWLSSNELECSPNNISDFEDGIAELLSASV